MNPGDRIRTTKFWLDYNYNTVKPATGTFVKAIPRTQLIRVKLDGKKQTERWHRDFWEAACSV
jgi:hypothetical protein